jgi:glucose-1-phosphate thymidylyltransferase
MVRETVETFRRTGASASVALAYSDNPEDYGVVQTDEGEITAIDEAAAVTEPASVNAGVYVFTEEIFDALDRTEVHDGELHLTDATQNLSGRVVASCPGGVWFDPSYPWDALRTMAHLLSTHSDLVDAEDTIDETARVHQQATVEAPALVGPGCEIGAGAVVRAGSCLRENVRIGPNATVERSIVDTDATVGANAMIRDTILGRGVELGAGTVSPGGSATLVVNGREYRDRRLGGVIADRVSIGANVTIAPGTRIGPSATVPHGVTIDGDVAEDTEVIA